MDRGDILIFVFSVLGLFGTLSFLVVYGETSDRSSGSQVFEQCHPLAVALPFHDVLTVGAVKIEFQVQADGKVYDVLATSSTLPHLGDLEPFGRWRFSGGPCTYRIHYLQNGEGGQEWKKMVTAGR